MGRFTRSRSALLISSIAVLFLVLAWVQKSPCLQTYREKSGTLALNWSNSRPYRDACYSDVVPLYTAERLNEPGAFPYQISWIENQGQPNQITRHMEYPVLTGLLMWASAKVAQGYSSLAESISALPSTMTVLVFFDVLALVAAAFWLLAIGCLRRLSGSRKWDALIAAASPLVIVQAYTNFDMMAVGMATAAIYAWSRRRLWIAGVLIGLGTAAKLYPVLLLIPLLALCLRAGRLSEWGRTAFAALISWEIVNAPILFLFPQGWLEFLRLNSTRGADPDTPYNLISQFFGWGGFDGPLGPGQTPVKLNSFVAGMLILCMVGIVTVILTSPRRPRLAQVGFLSVAAFLLVNKVWSPQYSLWLLPLLVLALPRWRWLLGWGLLESGLWVARMYFYLPESSGGWGSTPFLLLVLARDLLVAGFCARVLYEIYHPQSDLVRGTGRDDPAGGVLENAPDSFRLPALRPVLGLLRG